jgi:hypothetical protein
VSSSGSSSSSCSCGGSCCCGSTIDALLCKVAVGQRTVFTSCKCLSNSAACNKPPCKIRVVPLVQCSVTVEEDEVDGLHTLTATGCIHASGMLSRCCLSRWRRLLLQGDAEALGSMLSYGRDILSQVVDDNRRR